MEKGYKKNWVGGEAVACEACLTYYHLSCANISEPRYAKTAETVWYCRLCLKQQEMDCSETGVRVFPRYLEEIIRTVSG